jgi:hypothetical protein
MMQESTVFCGACGCELNDGNWYPSLQKQKTYRCHYCYAKKLSKVFCVTCGLSLQDGKCLRCELLKEDHCARCNALLTDDNWQPTFRKRNVHRCKACHAEVCASWEARNPGHGAKRQKTYHKRHPEKRVAYYEANKEKIAQHAINRLWRLKIAAIEQLGGKCAGCGTTDMRVLQINHLNGRGDVEDRFGAEIYAPIVAGTRTTDDLDVRCANCNVIYEYERGNRRAPVWYSTESDVPELEDTLSDQD